MRAVLRDDALAPEPASESEDRRPVALEVLALLDTGPRRGEQFHRGHKLSVDNVERIVVKLPEDGARIVNARSMPDVNCQHIIALALVDGAVSFEDSHSYERMADPKVLAAKERVQLIADRGLMDLAAPRSGLVEVTLRNGHTISHFTRHPPGTKENPLNTERVNEKARSLMTPVLGAERTEEVIRRVNALEKLNEVRELRPFLAG